MSVRRSPGRLVLSLVFVLAGVLHFVVPEFYLAMMPPWLPWHRELVLVSGAFEILGGVGLFVERTRRAAGWGLILLLIAVFPANLHMALNPAEFASLPEWALWLRLPFQGVLIWWVWRAARLRRRPD